MSLSRWIAMAAAVLAIGWYTLRDDGRNAAGIGPEGVSINADDPKQVKIGHKVYADNCASCHGANLEGQPNWKTRNANGRLPAPPHDASGHTWHHPDTMLFAITKYGTAAVLGQPVETDMPVFNGVLDDREIAAVLAYIKSTWPADIRAKHDELNARARKAAAKQ